MGSPTIDRRLGLSGNTAYKTAATALASANIALSGEQTVGGVAVKAINAAGVADRVLCTGQTDATTNGLWDVNTGTWTRSIDADGNYDWSQGTQVLIAQGTYAFQIWTLTTSNPITVGTTSLAFSPSLNAGNMAALAAASGSSLVGYLPTGSGAAATTVQNRLRRTASDLEASGATDAANYSQLPCYAAVSVNLTRTVLDKHAFEDWTTINTSGGIPLGYCSFDAKPTYTNSTPQLHLVGYQSRATFSGSANLNQYWHGYDCNLVHTGTGVITEASGVNIGDITGSGKANITNFYGMYIATLTAGAARYAIYSDAGNTHMFGGTTGSIFTGTIQSAGMNYNNDAVSKTMSFGFGTAGQTQFGTINFYNGKNSVVVSIQSSGLVVTGAINASGVTKSGSYTVATLPVASEGFIAYATDGRKVGQGAGAGTGVPVYYSAGSWRVFSTDAIVAA